MPCTSPPKKHVVYLDVSENRGTPKSSILIGFSIINHPFWGTPILEQGGIGAPMEPTEPISEAAGQNGVLYDSRNGKGDPVDWLGPFPKSCGTKEWENDPNIIEHLLRNCKGPPSDEGCCILSFIVILLLQMHDKLLQSSLSLVGALKIKPFMIHC